MARPKGSKNKQISNWTQLGTKISPEMNDYLEKQKLGGRQINLIVDKALRLYRDNDGKPVQPFIGGCGGGNCTCEKTESNQDH